MFGLLPTMIPVAIIVVGLLVGGIGVSTLLGGRRRRESWERVPGRVIGSRLSDNQLRCQVTFVLRGREVTFWNRYSSSFVIDPVGREVEVLVNPENPQDAVVARGLAGSNAVGISFVVFGVVALGFGTVILTA